MVAGGCRGVLPIECEQVAAMLLGLSLLQKRPTSSCTLVRNILLRRNHIPIALRASLLIATVLDRLHLKYGDTTITRTSTAWQRIQQQFMTTPRRRSQTGKPKHHYNGSKHQSRYRRRNVGLD